MKNRLAPALLLALAPSVLATSVSAASLTLNSVTSSLTSNISVTSTPGGVDANGVKIGSGLNMTGDSGLGDFLAWCLDIKNPISIGTRFDYAETDTPFSNSYVASDGVARVQNLFDASFEGVDQGSDVDAPAFQLALWEVSNDTDYSITAGEFIAAGFGTNAAAITARTTAFLDAAKAYLGPKLYDVTFFETRETPQTQNLVAANRLPAPAPVPVPAAGVMLVGALGGLSLLRRKG